MNSRSVILLGVRGHIVCVRRDDGSEVWRTRLRGWGVTSVCVEEDRVFAATKGHLYMLDLHSGAIRWTNRLPKLGYGMCLLGTPNQGALATIHMITQQHVAAAAAASAAAGAAASSS